MRVGSGSNRWMLSVLVIGTTLLMVGCSQGKETDTTAPAATDQPGPSVGTSTPAAETDVDSITEHLEAAATYFADGQYDKAIQELEAAVDIDPEDADAYTNLALSYFENGDYESAAEAWTRVIALAPETENAYLERGKSYFNLKAYEEAIDDLSDAIEGDAASAEAYRIRGKAYGFLEEYELAVADLSKTIELDPEADEAYLNRAVSTSKIGGLDDLPGIVADLGMVMQLSEDPTMRQQAESMLQNLLESSDDPILRQQATDALEGKVSTADATDVGDEPSLLDIDITREPGHSIGFEDSLEPGEAHRFLLLASPGDTVGAGVSSTADLLVGIQDTGSGQVLQAVHSGDDALFVTIPANSLYHIVIEDAGGEGGDYTAAFEASPKVSFALDPNYFMIGRLPEGGLLYYTYSAPRGSTLQGNVIPHPDTPVDLAVEVRELESQAKIAEYDGSGAGENEPFTFTVPETAGDGLLTYIVTVRATDGEAGAYILSVASDEVETKASPAESPEAVVQALFDAARSGQFDGLADLCDPRGENDGDTQMICDLAGEETNRASFVEAFEAGELLGGAEISPDGTAAQVPFVFGPAGDQEETMELINRDGQWYLYGF